MTGFANVHHLRACSVHRIIRPSCRVLNGENLLFCNYPGALYQPSSAWSVRYRCLGTLFFAAICLTWYLGLVIYDLYVIVHSSDAIARIQASHLLYMKYYVIMRLWYVYNKWKRATLGHLFLCLGVHAFFKPDPDLIRDSCGVRPTLLSNRHAAGVSDLPPGEALSVVVVRRPKSSIGLLGKRGTGFLTSWAAFSARLERAIRSTMR